MSKTERFFEMKRRGDPIAVLTAYDAPTAGAEAEAGVDILLVGDSVGANVLGYASERDVTLADMRHHVAAVRRGAPDAVIIGDLPFETYGGAEIAIASARALIGAGADIVKFEGADVAVLKALCDAGIEVCCHLGLEPQTHAEKRLKGRSAQEAAKLLADAIRLDAAGMKMLVLEMIPEEVAAEITRAVRAPTIGIGAGRRTDGQVLVMTDVLGFGGRNFRHNRRYQEVGRLMRDAASAYARDVHDGDFPAEENLVHMAPDELELFMAARAGV
ncbi:3-methyl-2-oxobutanoate hydroxymethyltransferase [Methylocella silvestris]|uniref:3-methyl-2-oxobutanoate hydroxymethyltransferase n=1 Tax=Methylocella silvestris TaxID=199596 RepID=A0A2J7TIE6_METSI|nr:3-methyl-2-oxobutanoate hydroxymethyltransferase [Methylocella silvestris]PNG26516.1 3-methyl-2-oxobutanoate hydroxymethyltransferase [Methylocella silvestris]